MPNRSTSAPDAESAPDSRVIPIGGEHAVLLKRKILTEGVSVRTVVHKDAVAIDEPIASEVVPVLRTVSRLG